MSHGWNKVTAERNMRSAELGLNLRIMRTYAHGKLRAWLRKSYNCEWTCGRGWRGDEVPVSLPPCCRSRVLWVLNTSLLARRGYSLLFVSKSCPNQTFHKKHQALKPIWRSPFPTSHDLRSPKESSSNTGLRKGQLLAWVRSGIRALVETNQQICRWRHTCPLLNPDGLIGRVSI